MATNPYGTISPQALDPYNIESTLADKAFSGQGNSVMAAYLDYYQNERARNQNLYLNELQGQHDLAREQMRASLQEKGVEFLAKAAEHPYLMETARPFFEGLGLNLDPNAYAAAGQQAVRTGLIGNYKNAMEGNYSGVQAGTPTNLPVLTAMTGLPQGSITQGRPLGLQIADVNAAGRIAAAQAHQSKPEHYMLKVEGPIVNGKPLEITVPVPIDASPDEVQRRVSAAQQGLTTTASNAPTTLGGFSTGRVQTLPSATTPPAGGPGGSSTSVSPTGRTNLPPANTTTSGAQAAPANTRTAAPANTQADKLYSTPANQAEPWTGERGEAWQKRGRLGLEKLAQSTRDDIRNLMAANNGIIILQIKRGVPYYVTSKRNLVPVP